MPLTEIEAHLIDALKMDGVRKGAAMAVCLMLKEEPQRMENRSGKSVRKQKAEFRWRIITIRGRS